MRKIKASAVKNICKFPSTKSFTGRSHLAYKMVLVESLLERDFCYQLEFDSNVQRYFTQPKTYVVDCQSKRNQKYTPDFEVHYRDGRKAFIEVKKNIATLDEEYVNKLKLVGEIMKSEGYEFYVIDEAKIRVQPLLENLKRLQRYRNANKNFETVLKMLKNEIPNPCSLGDLVSGGVGVDIKEIYSLVALGGVKVDLVNSKISLDMEACYA